MSFRETFTRDQRKNVLSYDTNAFAFFLFTIMSCVFLPWLLISLKNLFFTKPSVAKRLLNEVETQNASQQSQSAKKKQDTTETCFQCSCQFCRKLLYAEDQRCTSIKYRIKRWSFCLNWISLLVVFLILIFTYNQLPENDLETFDPYEILGISQTSDDRTMKRAYRTLSLRHHPDKNQNDPSAAAKFILVNKAYSALTNEIAKENYQKYGNPDGPGMMEIGIGLPHFLVDEKYQDFTLIAFLIIFVILLPAGFIVYYEKQKHYFQNKIQIETVHFFGMCFTKNAEFKAILELIAASKESRELIAHPNDAEAIKNICSLVQVPKKFYLKEGSIYRNYMILWGHLHRLHSKMTPTMLEDLKTLLKITMPMTNLLCDIASIQNWGPTAEKVVEARTCLLQAVTPEMSSCLQLPHYTAQMEKKKKLESLEKVVNMSPEERKRTLVLDDNQMKDINAYCDTIYQLEIDMDMTVLGESAVVEGDVITTNITIRRIFKNGQPKYVGAAHTYMYPECHFEGFHIFLYKESYDRLLLHSFVQSQEACFTTRVEFLASFSATIQFIAVVMSDVYINRKAEKRCNLTIQSEHQVTRKMYIHPEDLELDLKEVSLYDQIRGFQENETETDESDWEKGN